MNDSLISFAKRKDFKKVLSHGYRMKGTFFLLEGKFEQTEYFYNKSLELFQNINDIKGQGILYGNLAALYSRNGELEKSNEFYLKSISINEKTGHNGSTLNSYLNLGINAYKSKNYVESLEFYMKALEIAERIDNRREVAQAHSLLANVFLAIEKYSKGETHLLKALKIQNDLEDYYSLPGTNNKLAFVYEKRDKNYKKAFMYYQKALNYSKKLNDQSNIFNYYYNFGRINIYLKDYNKAKLNIDKGIQISNTIDDKDGKIRGHLLNAHLLIYLEKYKDALNHINTANELSRKNSRKGYIGLYQNISKAYAEKRIYEAAFENHKIYTMLLDSILNEKGLKKIFEIETKYQTEKKEKENLKLKQEKAEQELALAKESRNKWIGFGSSITLSLLLVSGYLFVRSRKRKMEKDQLLKQIWVKNEERNRFSRVLHNEIANPLLAIQENIKSIGLDNEAGIIRNVEERMRALSHQYEVTSFKDQSLYDQIQNKVIDLDGKIKVNVKGIDLLKSVNINIVLQRVIYNVIQESLINTMKYAEASKIDIDFFTEGKKLLIKISDNGRGFDVSQVKNEHRLFRNIKAEVNSVNGFFDFRSTHGKGTSIFTSFLVT